MASEPTSEVLLARARAAIEIGRFERALDETKRALAQDPESANGLALTARALLGLKRYEEAERAAQQGLRSAPQSEWLHRLHALALMNQGQHTRALGEVEDALRISAQSVDGLLLRSMILAKLGRAAEAMTAVERALALAADDLECLAHQGALLLDKDAKRAEALYRRCLEIDPNHAVSLNNLGVALQRQNRQWDAIVAFKAAVLADPTDSLAKRNTHNALGEWTKVVGVVGAGGAAAAGKVGIWKLLFFSSVLRQFTMERAAWAIGIVAAVFAVVWIVNRVVGAWRLRKLEAEDPQLFAIYQHLQSDHKAGRL